MLLDQEFRLIEFLIRLQNTVFDHLQCAAGTFARAEILQNKLVLPFPVIVEGRIFFVRGNDRVRNQLVLQLGLPHTGNELREAFIRLTITPIHVDQMRKRCRDGFRRQLHDHLSDRGRAANRPTEV